MARGKKSTDKEFEPKHRIAGAAILIGLAVIVLPLILRGGESANRGESEAPPSGELIPAPYVSSQEETRTFVSKITPIGGKTPQSVTVDAPAPQVERKAEQKPTVRTPQVEAPKLVTKAGQKPRSTSQSPAQPRTKPAAQPKVKPTVAAAPVKPASDVLAPQSGIEQGWMVRVGTFSDAANVKRVMADLRSKGFQPSSSATRTAKGPATRVWLGPYAKRVDAARVRTQLEKRTGEPGLITAYP